MYKIICSVVAPEKPTEMSYGDLTKKIREHFFSKTFADNVMFQFQHLCASSWSENT